MDLYKYEKFFLHLIVIGFVFIDLHCNIYNIFMNEFMEI